ARKAERQLRRRRRRLDRVESDLVRELEATLALLESWGYTDGWALTDRGRRLRTIYSELDLLLAESAETGLLDGLEVPEFVALATLFVYEPRRDSGVGEWPTSLAGERGAAIQALWAGLAADEQAARLSETRPPEPGFAGIAAGWASGATLEDLFEDDQMAAGDFVRTMRQLLDVIRQLRDTYPDLSTVASDALGLIDHGVVSAGGVA
ncbi:MAG: RNA helicase, partial [Acidimicrobiia bacterium]|nr:RNA helicase [Acidimicrobiia bacterium]